MFGRVQKSNLIHTESYPWESRDYCLPTIPCLVSVYPCNKNDKCELPSKIQIRADEKCQTGLDFIEESEKRKK